jgi:hypothetical protein
MESDTFESLMAFFVGVMTGFLITGFVITILVTLPREREAIQRGHAEYSLRDLLDKNSIEFKWK